jgi:hypothetical protein
MTSCAPWGRFNKPVLVYRMPEAGASGIYDDNGVIAYNAHVHAELSSGNPDDRRACRARCEPL